MNGLMSSGVVLNKICFCTYVQVELGIALGIFEGADGENDIFCGIIFPFVIVVGRHVIGTVVFAKN